MYAEPVTGTLAANSEYARAVKTQDMAPIMKEMVIPGPNKEDKQHTISTGTASFV